MLFSKAPQGSGSLCYWYFALYLSSAEGTEEIFNEALKPHTVLQNKNCLMDYQEAQEEPEGGPGGPGRGKRARARWEPASCFKLPWSSWPSFYPQNAFKLPQKCLKYPLIFPYIPLKGPQGAMSPGFSIGNPRKALPWAPCQSFLACLRALAWGSQPPSSHLQMSSALGTGLLKGLIRLFKRPHNSPK